MKDLKKILIVAFVLFLASCETKDTKEYTISVQETLKSFLQKDDIYPVEKIANILLCKHASKYQLIDIRTPHDFAINHLPNAVNVPSKDILDKKFYSVLNQDKKINVLYCTGGHQAINAYLMLKQLNYKNIKVALGGFNFINNYIIDNYGIKTGIYDDEKPRFDFIRLVKSVKKPKQDCIKKPSLKNINLNKKIRDFDEECPDLN